MRWVYRGPEGEQGKQGSSYFAADAGGSSKRARQGTPLQTGPGNGEPPDRRALASQQDALTALQEKLARLQQMAARNARDRAVSAQVARQIEQTRKELAAAQARSAHAQQAVHAKEKGKSWLKF